MIVGAGGVGVVPKVSGVMANAACISEESGWIDPLALAHFLVEQAASDMDILNSVYCLFIGRETNVVPAIVAQGERAHRNRVTPTEGSGREKWGPQTVDARAREPGQTRPACCTGVELVVQTSALRSIAR